MFLSICIIIRTGKLSLKSKGLDNNLIINQSRHPGQSSFASYAVAKYIYIYKFRGKLNILLEIHGDRLWLLSDSSHKP